RPPRSPPLPYTALFRSVLGTHRKEAPHEELRDRIRRVPLSFEARRQPGQPPGERPCDPRRSERRVQRLRIVPDGTEQRPHRIVSQVLQHDAVALLVGERLIGLTLPAEV